MVPAPCRRRGEAETPHGHVSHVERRLASRTGLEDGVEVNGVRLRHSRVREFLQDEAGVGSEQGPLAMRQGRFGSA